jgi:hypothetical protein
MVTGIIAATSDDITNAKELCIIFAGETENCVINVAELYKELLDSDAVIVTIPGCNNVTSFSSIVATVVSEDVYVHALVLSAGLVGSSIVNDGFVNDLFVINIEPT